MPGEGEGLGCLSHACDPGLRSVSARGRLAALKPSPARTVTEPGGSPRCGGFGDPPLDLIPRLLEKILPVPSGYSESWGAK